MLVSPFKVCAILQTPSDWQVHPCPQQGEFSWSGKQATSLGAIEYCDWGARVEFCQ